MQLLIGLAQLLLVPVPVVNRVELQLPLQRIFLKLRVDSSEHLFGLFAARVVVLVDDVADIDPLLEHCGAHLLFAGVAEIFDLSLLGLAHAAEVVEVDVQLEVGGDLLVLVLADVLGTQLHLPREYVVAVLDEASVEHDPAEGVAGESLVSEEDLDIACQRPSMVLLLCEREVSVFIFVLVVLPGDREREQSLDVESVALVNLKVRRAPIPRKRWDVLELDPAQLLDAGRLDLPAVKSLEVVEVPQLARLRDALTAGESLMAIEPEAVINIVEVAQEEQDRRNRSACAAFPGVAMNRNYVLRVSCKAMLERVERAGTYL